MVSKINKKKLIKKVLLSIYQFSYGNHSDSLSYTYYYSDYHFVFGSKCKLIIVHLEFVFF